MGKIVKEYETPYEVGDVIVFEKHGKLLVGIIEGYYIDENNFWFNVRTSVSNVYSYSNGGDIGEYDIVGKVEGELAQGCREEILQLR